MPDLEPPPLPISHCAVDAADAFAELVAQANGELPEVGALLARRLRVAQALGCRLVAAETGAALPSEPNPSEHNLRALGLQPVAMRDNWVRPGTTWR